MDKTNVMVIVKAVNFRQNQERIGEDMDCKCAKFDPDSGRYDCAVSGDGCIYMIPNSKRCAEEYGEGPDATDDVKQPSGK